jgi:Ca-activated chloride channel family protein
MPATSARATTVTALYEITPVGSGAELNDPLRYGRCATPTARPCCRRRDRLPQAALQGCPTRDTSQLIEVPIAKAFAVIRLAAARRCPLGGGGRRLRAEAQGLELWRT